MKAAGRGQVGPRGPGHPPLRITKSQHHPSAHSLREAESPFYVGSPRGDEIDHLRTQMETCFFKFITLSFQMRGWAQMPQMSFFTSER